MSEPKEKKVPKKADPKAQYDVALNLTTPNMVGQKVKDAQWLMAGNNRFNGLATYKDGAIDGIYGQLTAQATYRTKYWLGYPTGAIDRSFGQVLYEYLLEGDVRKLPTDYVQRRKQRLDAAEVSKGQKALNQAITQIGTKESPYGSNMQKYGSWYRMNGVPWCSIFVSWCFAQTGTTYFRYSYVPAVHQDASVCRNRLCVVRTPRPGDMACYTFNGIRDAHIEFFEKWESGSMFTAVGGNTGSASFSNGGAVERNTRYTSLVDAFVRIT